MDYIDRRKMKGVAHGAQQQFTGYLLRGAA